MKDFTEFTEVSGTFISKDQLYRMSQRYTWASSFINSTDKCLELCCGSGQGIRVLERHSDSLSVVDITPALTEQALLISASKTEVYTSEAISFLQTVEDNKFDKIILFEAIYYFENFKTLLNLVFDKLTPGGLLLISSPNPLLSTFNKSPHSFFYPSGIDSFTSTNLKFDSSKISVYGASFPSSSIASKLLRFLKIIAVRYHLIPKTMTAKRFIKRVFTGKLVKMPSSLSFNPASLEEIRGMPGHSEIVQLMPQVLFFSLEK